jgi:hypothetical protein
VGILPAINNNIQSSIDTKTENTEAIAIETQEASKMLLANIHQHPGCLDFCLKSIPIQPWSHQLKILLRSLQLGRKAIAPISTLQLMKFLC